MTLKFIHLTDSHLVKPPQKLFGKDVAEHLRRAVDSINANHGDAAFCVVTGDITHWGEREAYDIAREALDALAVPSHILIGNHDEREALCRAFPGLPTADGFVQYMLDTPAGHFLMLDTVAEGTPGGVLCPARLQWLRTHLIAADAAGASVYIFMHHAPFPVGIRGMDDIRLENADDFWAAIDAGADVRYIFFGHLHRACHGIWRGVPFVSMGALSYQVGLVMDDTSPIHVCDDGPSYGVVTIAPSGVIIHHHHFLTEGTIRPYDRGIPAGSAAPPDHQKAWG